MNKLTIAFAFILSFSLHSHAGLFDETEDDIIQPDVINSEINVAQLDTELFEIGAYVGFIAIEDFGSEPLLGLTANFHATEDLFIQTNYAFANVSRSTLEKVQDAEFFSDRKYTSYDFLVGWNALPGEVFITSNWTFNSVFYLIAGVGNTELADDKYFTFTWGTGYRIILAEGFSFHVDYKDHMFDTDLLGQSKTTHNIEISSGINYFF